MKCEYCKNNGEQEIIASTSFEFQIMNMGGYWIVDVDFVGMSECKNGDFKINYCPMCGRKLED